MTSPVLPHQPVLHRPDAAWNLPRLGSDLKIVDAHTVVVHDRYDALTVVAVVNRIVEPDLEGFGGLRNRNPP